MNTIKTFALVTSLVFASAGAVAQSGEYNGRDVRQSHATIIYTEATQNKQESYLLGLDKLHTLESSTAKELKKQLNAAVWYQNSFHLKEGSYVTVQEKMNSEGEIEYVSAVNVIYHYQERASNNR
ncbi:MAG: hypothetical protein ACJAT7_000160 [Psychromonas sp.]|jgi:hypothetical protein|uniref:DUF3316 domain-containing protein n=1 Tax=Psychromonas sp. TaxID=1884585 RepID=UPI0039E22BC1